MLTEHCNGMLPYGSSHPVPVVCPSPLHFHNGYSPSPRPCKSIHPQYHTSLLSFYDIVIPLHEHVPHKNILSNFLASIQQQLNKYIHFRVFLVFFYLFILFQEQWNSSFSSAYFYRHTSGNRSLFNNIQVWMIIFNFNVASKITRIFHTTLSSSYSSSTQTTPTLQCESQLDLKFILFWVIFLFLFLILMSEPQSLSIQIQNWVSNGPSGPPALQLSWN